MLNLNRTFAIFAGQKTTKKEFDPGPSLYRDFVIDPQLNGPISISSRLGPDLIFNRNSQATFFNNSGNIQTAAINAARFEHGPDQVYRGLLVEEQRTNFINYSNNFSQASTWLVAASSDGPGIQITSAPSIQSPDGSFTTTKLTQTTARGFHSISWTPGTDTDDEYYDRSIFIKQDTARYIVIGCAGTPFESNVFTTYDLQLSSFSENTPFDKVYAEPINNGWVKVGFLRDSTFDNTNTNRLLIGFTNSTGDNVFFDTPLNPIDCKSVYVWGAQVEKGLQPTSYIPTNGQQVTRASDNITVDGLNFIYLYNKQGGSFTVKASRNYSNSLNSYASFNVPDSSFYWSINNNQINSNALTINSVTQTTISAAPVESKIFYTMTAGLTGNVFTFYQNQTFVNQVTGSSSIPVIISQFELGRRGNNYLNGHIQKFGYWPRLLSNNELQAL